ncbi:ABC transporter permease/M1 family aminopeptidase [Pontibacter sp. MBLB2868]|uniref:ABC transporter permease/M1 family aminopeptidase n=1 Tax=Pontibacter sp. MBLB2868 TaxID=3451555 RepID=UPI003F756F2E
MKFLKIFRFEFTYQVRSISVWLYFVVVAVLSYLWMIGNYLYDARDGYFLLNAPSVIATVTVLSNLFWLLFGASVAGDAAARDVHTRMFALTYTAPASKLEYLGGRFLAAFSINMMLMLAIPLGTFISLNFSGVEAEILGPARVASYLTSIFYIILPNVFVVTAIQFSLAAVTRSAMASYLGGAILFAAAFVLELLSQDAGEWRNMIDPIGFTLIMGHQSDWSLLERNTRLILLEGPFLVNRLLWLSIAMGMLGLTYARFHFKVPEEGQKKKQAIQPSSGFAGLEWLKNRKVIALPPVSGTFGFATHLRQLRLIAWKSFLQLAKSKAGLVLLAALALMVTLAMEGNLKAKGVPMLRRTDYVLNYLTAPLTDPKSFWIILVMLIVFYAGELVWREREAGLSEIANAAPVPEWVLFLGRFLALSLLMVVWLVFLMAAGVMGQISMGWANVDIGLYLQVLFGLQLVECLLFALLALLVHVLINQKFVGHLVASIAYGLIAFAASLGVEHKLLVYSSSPAWTYTDMAGFGTSLAPWFWFKLYWLVWALLLAMVAKLFWVRSRDVSITSRLRLARLRFTRQTALVALAAGGSVFVMGSFIFYNTNFLHTYTPSTEAVAQRAQYEQLYGKYAGIQQPQLTSTNLKVEIYPEQGEVEIKGTYLLVNKTNSPIDSVHVTPATETVTTAITFDRPATQVLANEELDYLIYTLSKPLQTGDSVRLTFEVRFKSKGFSNKGADSYVMANGTNFRNYEWLPAIGYQPFREVDEAGARKKYGLAPRPATSSLYNKKARLYAPFPEHVAFEAVVGTEKDQVIVAPGRLLKTWTKGIRRYFHYTTDAPIRNEYNFFSANYAVHKGKWKDVDIEIYYDPGQTENLERMVQSIQASLEYYTQQFGPYPQQQIRFVSHPGYSFGNHAAPINITAEEGFFLLNPKADPRGFDLVTAVVAHEVAHQWWGNQIKPAQVEGGGLLSESLAWYSAMGALEEKYGPEHLSRLLSFLREENENPRTRASSPLLQATDPYQYYRKGPFALYGLSQYIGREKVDAALRGLLEKHRLGSSPVPATSLDLYRELKAATPDTLQYLLHDLFEKNTFWELKMERATAEKTAAGDWQVTLEVQARKVVVDKIGVETVVPMKDWIEIGVFAPAKEGEKLGKPLYLQKHRIGSGKQKITVRVPRKPSRVGVEPNNLLIDWEMDDNFKDLKL